MSTKPDGYRYVRRYRNRAGKWAGWALYEVVEGRARRMGTARTEAGWRAWLLLGGDEATTSPIGPAPAHCAVED